MDKGAAARLYKNMFEGYEKKSLPSEEEFVEIQKRLGIVDMGNKKDSTLLGSSKVDDSKSTINLYSDILYEQDEGP